VEVRSRPCQWASGRSDSDERNVLTVCARGGSDLARAAPQLSIEGKDAGDALGPADLAVTDLPTILRSRLTGLNPRISKDILEFVSSAPAAHGLDARDLALSKRLLAVREALREALPPVVIDRHHAQGGHVDGIVAVDDTAFFAFGWMRDGEAKVTRLTAVCPEGERVEILERLFRHPYSELKGIYADGPYMDPVEKASGWVVYFETKRLSHLHRGWVFELENEAGSAAEIRVGKPVVGDSLTARRMILHALPLAALPDERLMSEHVFPAMSRLHERARGLVKVGSLTDFGEPNETPEVSVVIPLYQRLDLVEHQLAQFVHDPEMQSAELLYILDSPELDKVFLDQAEQLFRLYRVPFRVLTMARPSGFAAATNAGASVARGRLLLLLNSDVLPDKPGWLGSMQRFYDSKEQIGALGVKLLYEDDSLQHAGLYFEVVNERPFIEAWKKTHYFKGMNRNLAAANVARKVPAVTGACLMIDKQLYERVGRLTDEYVLGEYEDSDLCLRLIEAGRENWYLPDAELYHLEGQSFDDSERQAANLYSRWRHTRRWGELMRAVMARNPHSGGSSSGGKP
jgi:GT2 family glycosyltransferase